MPPSLTGRGGCRPGPSAGKRRVGRIILRSPFVGHRVAPADLVCQDGTQRIACRARVRLPRATQPGVPLRRAGRPSPIIARRCRPGRTAQHPAPPQDQARRPVRAEDRSARPATGRDDPCGGFGLQG